MKRKTTEPSSKEYNCDADDEYEKSEDEIDIITRKVRKISINGIKKIYKPIEIKFKKVDVRKVPTYIN